MVNPEKAKALGSKVHTAMIRLPEGYIPLILGYVLRQYGRCALAEIVEKGWDWKAEEGGEW